MYSGDMSGSMVSRASSESIILFPLGFDVDEVIKNCPQDQDSDGYGRIASRDE